MVARTTAHGDATIMNVIARSNDDSRSFPSSIGTANIAALQSTTVFE